MFILYIYLNNNYPVYVLYLFEFIEPQGNKVVFLIKININFFCLMVLMYCDVMRINRTYAEHECLI